MKTKRQLSYFFIAGFILLWVIGPLTQLIQIVSLPLHVELGLSEAAILEGGFGWFRADELAIAWADMTYLVAGVVFVIGVFMRRSWAIPFGFYTSATWSFILLMARIRWPLLDAAGYTVIASDQRAIYYAYTYLFILFGWFSMVYLWRKRNIYEGS